MRSSASAAHRPELEHLEEAAATADALAAVEDRPAARDELDERDHQRDGQSGEAEQRRERDVEHAQLEVDPAVLRLGRESDVAPHERLFERWRRRLHPLRW